MQSGTYLCLTSTGRGRNAPRKLTALLPRLKAANSIWLLKDRLLWKSGCSLYTLKTEWGGLGGELCSGVSLPGEPCKGNLCTAGLNGEWTVGRVATRRQLHSGVACLLQPLVMGQASQRVFQLEACLWHMGSRAGQEVAPKVFRTSQWWGRRFCYWLSAWGRLFLLPAVQRQLWFPCTPRLTVFALQAPEHEHLCFAEIPWGLEQLNFALFSV